MAKFCPQCGTSCDDNAAFCGGCGNQFAPAAPQQPQYQAPQQPVYQAPQQPQYQAPPQPVYQAPQQPQYQAPQYQAQQAPSGSLADTLKKNLKAVIAIFTVVMLLVGVLNILGEYDVTMAAEVSAEGRTQDMEESGSLADMRESMDSDEEEVLGAFGGLGDEAQKIIDNIKLFITSSWVLGIAAVLAAVLGAYSLSLQGKNPADSLKFFGYAAIVGGLGCVAALVMALIGGNTNMTIEMYGMDVSLKVTLSAHFTYWLGAIVGAGALVAHKGILTKK